MQYRKPRVIVVRVVAQMQIPISQQPDSAGG